MAFFGIFSVRYRDQSTTSHSDLSLMIFTSHSDPVIFWPFFSNEIFSTHKRKVLGHQKLVNIGPSDQSFISGKVVLLTNNPAEKSQIITFQNEENNNINKFLKRRDCV